MGYTKVLEKGKWKNVLLEDLVLVNQRKPDFIFAGRFKVFRIRVIHPDNLHERKIAWFIQGNEVTEETAIIFMVVDLNYNSIESCSTLNSRFDKELLFYLTKCLLVSLRDSEVFYLPATVLSEKAGL